MKNEKKINETQISYNNPMHVGRIQTQLYAYFVKKNTAKRTNFYIYLTIYINLKKTRIFGIVQTCVHFNSN